MNSVVLLGRLTKDPDNRVTQGGKAVTRYTLAVDRRVKKGEQSQADFIPCIVWDKGAEFASKYFKKGTKILIRGRIQTGSYEKDGRTIYTTDIVVEEQEFAESKASSESKPESKVTSDGFMNIPDGIDEELPFN